MPEVNIDAEEFDTIIFKIKSNKSGTARLFWASTYDPRMNEPKSLWFFIDKSSDYKEYVFNVKSQNPYWMGFTGQILIYSDNGPEGVEIKSAKAVTGNLLTNLKSGWREFWGPRGRVVIGSTINVIPSSSIFGSSINVYIYWLTGIFFLAVFAWKRSFYAAGRWAIYFALAAWLLLGINANLNYFNIFKDNFSKYFGKTIEEKRAVAYGVNYYNFLEFVRKSLPAEPVKLSIISSLYAPDLQARIFLIPHILADPTDKSLQYLLIYHPSPDQKYDKKSFSLYAGLREDEYILKRIK